MQSHIPKGVQRAKHLVHSELLFRLTKQDLQKLYRIFNVDIIISASFSTALPARILYWISDLTSPYQAEAINWIEPSDNFMQRVEEVAKKNIEKLYDQVKRREENKRRCYCCLAPGHIVRSCPNPSWVQMALAASAKVAGEAHSSGNPQEEPMAEPATPFVENKCNLCKGNIQCTCQAIAEVSARDPQNQCLEELTPVPCSIKDV